MDKREVRRAVKAEVREFLKSEAAVKAASQAVWAEVEALPEFASAHTVLLYAALPDEVPTMDFIQRWSGISEATQSTPKRIVLPVVVGENLILREYAPETLVPGYMDILEPSPEAATVSPADIDLALVPGVAFTLDGYRLGRGKGFYDRLLPSLNCPKVGIAFPCQIQKTLSTDAWDVRLDRVVCGK